MIGCHKQPVETRIDRLLDFVRHAPVTSNKVTVSICCVGRWGLVAILCNVAHGRQRAASGHLQLLNSGIHWLRPLWLCPLRLTQRRGRRGVVRREGCSREGGGGGVNTRGDHSTQQAGCTAQPLRC